MNRIIAVRKKENEEKGFTITKGHANDMKGKLRWLKVKKEGNYPLTTEIQFPLGNVSIIESGSLIMMDATEELTEFFWKAGVMFHVAWGDTKPDDL